MFPTTKSVKINNEEILCKDLTYGFMLGLQDGSIAETKHDVIMNATDLSEEDIKNLRVSEVDVLYSTITRLTYPHMYDEDGNMKDLDDDFEEDKKKV